MARGDKDKAVAPRRGRRKETKSEEPAKEPSPVRVPEPKPGRKRIPKSEVAAEKTQPAINPPTRMRTRGNKIETPPQETASKQEEIPAVVEPELNAVPEPKPKVQTKGKRTAKAAAAKTRSPAPARRTRANKKPDSEPEPEPEPEIVSPTKTPVKMAPKKRAASPVVEKEPIPSTSTQEADTKSVPQERNTRRGRPARKAPITKSANQETSKEDSEDTQVQTKPLRGRRKKLPVTKTEEEKPYQEETEPEAAHESEPDEVEHQKPLKRTAAGKGKNAVGTKQSKTSQANKKVAKTASGGDEEVKEEKAPARTVRAPAKARQSPARGRGGRVKAQVSAKASAAEVDNVENQLNKDEEAQPVEQKISGVQVIVNFEVNRQEPDSQQITTDAKDEEAEQKAEKSPAAEADALLEEKHPVAKTSKRVVKDSKPPAKAPRGRKGKMTAAPEKKEEPMEVENASENGTKTTVSDDKPLPDSEKEVVTKPAPEVGRKLRKRKADEAAPVSTIEDQEPAKVPNDGTQSEEVAQEELPAKRKRREKVENLLPSKEPPRNRQTRRNKNNKTDEIGMLLDLDKKAEIEPVVVGLVETIKEQVASFVESDSFCIDKSTDLLIADARKSPEGEFRLSTQEFDQDFENTSHDDTMEFIETATTTNDKTSSKETALPVLKKIRLRPHHSVVQLPKVCGKLMTFGDDSGGELGLGVIGLEKLKPEIVEAIKDPVAFVTAGAMHTACLTTSFQLYTFGCNDECALGRDTTEVADSEAKPAKVPIPVDVVKVSAGDSHTAALTVHGTVYLMGNFRDQSGRIGLTPDSTDSVLDPSPIIFEVAFVDIVSGCNHLLMLSEDGDVYSMGVGEQGQLGRVAADTAKFERSRASVFLKPEKIVVDEGVYFDKIWAGHFVSFARSTTGDLYAWGLNNHFQLGFKSIDVEFYPKILKSFSKSTICYMIGGLHHSLALDEDGFVYSCGNGEYGRLGHGQIKQDEEKFKLIAALKSEPVISIACGTCCSFAVTKKGKLFSWGMEATNLGIDTKDKDLWEPTEVKSKTISSRKVLSVSAGSQHTAVIVASDDEATNGN